MKVREYFQALGIDASSYIDVNFVIGESVGEGPTKKFMYRNSPVRTVNEWFGFDRPESVLNYNILNIKQPVISWMSGVDWNGAIQRNQQMSILVISDEELYKQYSQKQGNSMLQYIDKKIMEGIENGTNPWINKKR